MFDFTNTPAILSTENAPRVTSRYNHVNTFELIDLAEQVGWVTMKQGQARRNKSSLERGLTRDSAKHFCQLRPSDEMLEQLGINHQLVFDGGSRNYSKVFPTMLLYNSHDGLLGLYAELGLFEVVCANGLILCSDHLGQLRWRHVNISVDDIKNKFTEMLQYAPWVIGVRNFLQGINVSYGDACHYAEKVIELRWDNQKFAVTPEAIVRPRFDEQSDLNVYNVFQSAQYALINGKDFSIKNLNPTVRENSRRQSSPVRRARNIKNFAEIRRINKGLWTATQSWVNSLGYTVPEFNA